MTAVARKMIEETQVRPPEGQSLDAGAGLELFVTGSAPSGHDMMAGDGVELFVTGSAPTGVDMTLGESTGLYAISI